jgi:hypothetical protein
VPDDEALHPGPPGEDIGLRFVCLNASIARQFEFVQTAWVAGTKFGGLTQESDPLLGNRQPVAAARSPAIFRCRSRVAPAFACAKCRNSSPCMAAPTSSFRAFRRCAIWQTWTTDIGKKAGISNEPLTMTEIIGFE